MRQPQGAAVDRIWDVEYDREEDGRWIANIPAMPGAMAYGATRDEARKNAIAVAEESVLAYEELGLPLPDAVRATPDER